MAYSLKPGKALSLCDMDADGAPKIVAKIEWNAISKASAISSGFENSRVYGRVMPKVRSNSEENLLMASPILAGCSPRVVIIRSVI